MDKEIIEVLEDSIDTMEYSLLYVEGKCLSVEDDLLNSIRKSKDIVEKINNKIISESKDKDIVKISLKKIMPLFLRRLLN